MNRISRFLASMLLLGQPQASRLDARQMSMRDFIRRRGRYWSLLARYEEQRIDSRKPPCIRD